MASFSRMISPGEGNGCRCLVAAAVTAVTVAVTAAVAHGVAVVLLPLSGLGRGARPSRAGHGVSSLGHGGFKVLEGGQRRVVGDGGSAGRSVAEASATPRTFLSSRVTLISQCEQVIP